MISSTASLIIEQVLSLFKQALQSAQPGQLHHERALGLDEQQGHGFENDLANLLWRLADCYHQLGNRDKSKTYEARAKQIREELQKPT